MKFKLLLLILSIVFATSCMAQSPFKPLPKPVLGSKFALADTLTTPPTINSFRPVLDVTAAVSNGTSLAGGFGIGWQHNIWDATSQAYLTQYSISAIGFLGTNGSKATGTAGLVVGLPGTNGLVGFGGGYDFTDKQFVLLTGVQIKFN